MDDIIIASSESVDDILGIFNFLHTRLQFTMEVDTDGRISFLDTLLMEEGKLIFDGYRKAIFSGRFLNFNSHHPVIREVIYEVIELSS